MNQNLIKFKPKMISKLSIAFVYFTQGIYLSLISNIPYFYETYPSTQTLNYFNLAVLPFSIKYLTALIVQKFSFFSYGRRKFWIILTHAITFPLTYMLSYIITDSEKAIPTTILLFLIMLMVSMGDVAVDAIAVKDLMDPVLAGKLQAIMQPLGIVVNNYLIILLTHRNVWSFLGVNQPLSTPGVYLRWMAIIGSLITIGIHLKYKQRKMQNEQETNNIIDIFKYYKHFIQIKYSLCRQAIFFLLFHQGINFFISLFTPYVIQRGFPKEDLQEIGSHCVILSIAVNFLMSRFVTLESQYKIFLKVYFLEIFIFICVYLQGSFSYSIVIFTSIFMTITTCFRFLICSTIISSFGTGKYAGLCITTIASLYNFGRNSWPQLTIKEYVGFNKAIGGGLLLGIVIGIAGGRWTAWIKEGQPQDQLPQQKID